MKKDKTPLRKIYTEVGKYDLEFPDQNIIFSDGVDQFSKRLTENNIEYVFNKVNGGHNGAAWDQNLEKILMLFFGRNVYWKSNRVFMIKQPLKLPVEYALISSKALQKELLPFYKFPEESIVTLIHQGFHDTYLIKSPTANFILRIYKAGWKTFEQVNAELDLLQFLKAKGIAVSYPVEDGNKSLIHKIQSPEGERFAVIFSYAPGQKISSLNSNQATLFGKRLASMHSVTFNRQIQNLHRTYTVDSILDSTLTSIRTALPDNKNAYEKLEAVCKVLKRKLAGSVLANLRSGICHGDPHHENAFLETSSNTLTFFDFDFSGNGFLLYDLGSFSYYERDRPGNIEAFLVGYESIMPLNRLERDLLPDFRMLMRLFHLGARSTNADGVKNPIWVPEEITMKIDEIEKEVTG